MRHDARIAGKHHPHPGAKRLAEVVALQLPDFAVLAQVVLQHAVLGAFGLGVVGVVDVHREPDRAGAGSGELDPFVVDQAGVLDRVDPAFDRGLDPGCAVGMSGDAQPPHVGFIGDCGQFGLGQLLLARLGIVAEDPAGRADLDYR